jgi:hypothetical protein
VLKSPLSSASQATPRPSQIPTSESDAPPSAGQFDQEFLYHLYRGSELLKDNSVDEAKAELERALKLQPKDVEGQGLLGVVYFRLGLYPRAIEIYEQLQRVAPLEVAPRINLALCYLKTAQADQARLQLEEALRLAPDHQRAWGYLGLVFQRFGDFEKARVAFERAGRPKLAERMAELARQDTEPLSSFGVPELNPESGGPSLIEPSTPSFRPSLMPASMAPEPASVRPASPPKALEPGAPSAALPSLPIPALPLPAIRAPLSSVPIQLAPASASGYPTAIHQVPAPIQSWAQNAELVFPERPHLVVHPSGQVLVRVRGSLVVRTTWLGALLPDRGSFQTHGLRRGKTKSAQAPELLSLEGHGRAVLQPEAGQLASLFEMDPETPFTVLERRVVAFEPELHYDVQPLDPLQEQQLQCLRLKGSGCLVVRSSGPLHAVLIQPERPALVRAELAVGWFGTISSRVVPPIEAPAGAAGMASFSGRGTLLVDSRAAGAQMPGSAENAGAAP